MTSPKPRDLLLALVREAAQAGVEAVADGSFADPKDAWSERQRIAREVAQDTEGPDGWTAAAQAVLDRMLGSGPLFDEVEGR